MLIVVPGDIFRHTPDYSCYTCNFNGERACPGIFSGCHREVETTPFCLSIRGGIGLIARLIGQKDVTSTLTPYKQKASLLSKSPKKTEGSIQLTVSSETLVGARCSNIPGSATGSGWHPADFAESDKTLYTFPPGWLLSGTNHPASGQSGWSSPETGFPRPAPS